MKSIASTVATGAFLVSLAAVISITFVLDFAVLRKAEVIIRGGLGILGLLAVPSLIALAYLIWMKHHRLNLSAWRNRLALASMTVTSGGWLLYAIQGLSVRSRLYSLPFFYPVLIGTLLFCAEGAALLAAIALEGSARVLMVAAALILWAWIKAGIYT